MISHGSWHWRDIAEIPLVRGTSLGESRPVSRRPWVCRPCQHCFAAEAMTTRSADVLQGLLLGLEGRRRVTMPAGGRLPSQDLSHSRRSRRARAQPAIGADLRRSSAVRTLRERAHRRHCRCRRTSRGDRRTGRSSDARPRPPVLCRYWTMRLSEGPHCGDWPRTVIPRRLPRNPLEVRWSSDLPDRQQAIETLSSRPDWAGRLLGAVQSGAVPRTDVTAFTARQFESLGDEQLTNRLRSLWGEVRPTSDDRLRQIAALREQLDAEEFADADLTSGPGDLSEAVCDCHRLFDAGGNIGPDLTGAQRTNLDYLLENVVDPVPRWPGLPDGDRADDHGSGLTGLVVAESAQAVIADSQRTDGRSDRRDRGPARGRRVDDAGQLLRPLSFEETRNLFGYLSSLEQCELPAGIDAVPRDEHSDH